MAPNEYYGVFSEPPSLHINDPYLKKNSKLPVWHPSNAHV